MVFEKGNDFVEITQARYAYTGNTVWIVDTNLGFRHLPAEFRVQVSETDKEGFVKLKNAVEKWADGKGFKLVSKT